MDIEEILAEAEDPAALPTTRVAVCLRGSLAVRYDELEAKLRAVPPATSLGDGGAAARIAEQMDAVRQEMLAHERAFVFRALPDRVFSPLRDRQPQRADKKYETDEQAYVDDYHLWVCEVVAAACIDPVMTPAQADRLSVALGAADWTRIVNGAWLTSASKKDIPFSNAAFALTAISGAKSRRPPEPEPAEAGSLAGPADPSPSTSTTAPVD